MKFNPIVKRDITVGARSTRLPVLVLLMNGIVFGVDLLGMFGQLSRYRLEQRVSCRSMLTVYALAAVVIFLIVLFLYPSFTSGSVTGERESGTYDILLASGLRPFRIISGKLIARLLPGLVLLASFLPALILPPVFGGVEIRQAVFLLVLFVPLVLELMCIGLYAGTRAKSGSTAGLLAYGIVFGITFLPLLLAALGRSVSGSGKNTAAALTVLCPAVSIGTELADQLGESAALGDLFDWLKLPASSVLRGNAVAAGVIAQLLLAALFFLLSLRAAGQGRTAVKRKAKELQSVKKSVE